MSQGSAVFWSYSHQDDQLDRSRIVELARHVQQEYSLLTGTELIFFLDRDSIEWGDAWRQRIDNALSSSTFFVPVVSPRYFKRPECRKELLDFFGEADSRRLLKLMLPVYYSSVDDFTADNPDELLALTARSQFVDWTHLRLTDINSVEYRTAVNQLAKRLVELGTEVGEIENSVPDSGGPGLDSPEPGLYDALKRITELLPAWLVAVEDDPITQAQYEATDRTYAKRMASARAGQKLALMHRRAVDLLPLAKQGLSLARAYSAQSIELHPFVTTAVRAIRAAPEHVAQLDPLHEGVLAAEREINRSEAILDKGKGHISSEFWQARVSLGRTFRELAEVHTESERFRAEGNSVVRDWARQIEGLYASNTKARSRLYLN